jgi:hypothetical protein
MNRLVFIKINTGEIGPTDLLSVKKGDVFRMESPRPDLDPYCPDYWMVAKGDGFARSCGTIQEIECDRYPQSEKENSK